MRQGAIGRYYQRLTKKEIQDIDQASRKLLWNPGISVENERAQQIFRENGAILTKEDRVKIPNRMIKDALETVPKVVKMGARKENELILDGSRCYFVTGGCATKLIEFERENGELQPREKQTKPDPSQDYEGGFASLSDFIKFIKIVEQLENIDGLSRIMEPDLPPNLQDLAKVFLYLNYTTKHCSLANLVDINSLAKVIRVAEIIAGGREALRENPLISFITCLTVSPLRLVPETTEKFMKIVKEEIPVAISSDPQAMATSSVDEMGQLIQNNAEILSALVLRHLINSRAPVLYGAIPLTLELSQFRPQWGSPEDFARLAAKSQLARYYGIPCYGTAGVPDVIDPQDPSLTHLVVQTMHSYIFEAGGGAEYIHNAFGLWNTGQGFVACPEKYVIDDELLARVKFSLIKTLENTGSRIELIQKAVAFDYSSIFREDGRRKGRKLIYRSRHFQDKEISWKAAYQVKEELLSRPVEHLPIKINQKILQEFPELKKALTAEILRELEVE